MGMYALVARVAESKADDLLSNPEGAAEVVDGDDFPKLDLDKSWHVLHFSLTGQTWLDEGPAAFLLLGGRPVGEDGGYGPARLFMPKEVTAIAEKVAALTENDIRRTLDHPDAGELYGGWGKPHTEEEIRYLTQHMNGLQAFLEESVGNALLVELV